MIAGAGEFPVLIARQAYQEGWLLPTVALSEQVAATLAPYCHALVQYGPGQVTKILRALRQYEVRRVVIVGKVRKQFLFEHPRLDWRALRMLSRVRDYRDRALFDVISAELAREGLEVIEQTQLLGHLLTPAGVMTTRRPSAREWADIRYGFEQAAARFHRVQPRIADGPNRRRAVDPGDLAYRFFIEQLAAKAGARA